MAKRSRRSRIIWGAAGVVVLALLVFAFLPKPIVVDGEKVERRTMRVTLDAEGRTRIRDLYVISMPVTGELERVGLREGDRIMRGMPIGTVVVPQLDPAQRGEIDRRIEAASAAEREAASVVDRAATSLEQLKRESDRLRPLAAEGAVAAQDLERS